MNLHFPRLAFEQSSRNVCRPLLAYTRAVLQRWTLTRGQGAAAGALRNGCTRMLLAASILLYVCLGCWVPGFGWWGR